MRLIDADALKMYMRNALEKTRNCYPDGGEWAATITEEFCKDIDEQSTIEERPIGHWILHKDENGNVIFGECSKCGMKQRAGIMKFCYECGAKMEVEQ